MMIGMRLRLRKRALMRMRIRSLTVIMLNLTPIRNGKVESDNVSVQTLMWGLARAQLTNPGRGRAGFGGMPLFPHLPQ